jgi:hypothetical protein
MSARIDFELGQIVWHKLGQRMVVIEKHCFTIDGAIELYKCEWQQADGTYTWHKFHAESLSAEDPNKNEKQKKDEF